MSISKLNQIINRAFSDENPTVISVKDFKGLPLNEWQYINDGKIRYKVTEFTRDRCLVLTEWMDDDTFLLHAHDDADEVIFIVLGWVEDKLHKIKRYAFQKLFYKANNMHKLYAPKDTLILVEFTFLD